MGGLDCNMLNILVAIVSSLGEAGLKVNHPAEYEDGDNDKSNGDGPFCRDDFQPGIT